MFKKLALITITTITSLGLAVVWHQPINATGNGKKLNIVLVGDSYSSGNGAGDYTGVKNCYRSQRNWAQLYVRWLNHNGVATTFQNRACSGSKIEDLYNYRDLEVYHKTTFLPGNLTSNPSKIYDAVLETGICQSYTADDSIETRLSVTGSTYIPQTNQTVAQFKCFQRLRPQLDFIGPETDLVLMTIGGNDLDFAEIVKQCFFFRFSASCSNLIQKARNSLNAMKKNLNELFQIMRQRGLRSDTKVILLGYPLLSLNNNYTIGLLPPGYPVAQEIRALGLAGNQIQSAAVAADNQKYPGQVTFVSTVPRHFYGHEPDPDLFRENPDRWLHEFSGYSLLDGHGFYHPNLMGHANYTHLLKQIPIDSLIKPITKTSSDIDVVFNIDTSRSMSDLLEHTKDNIRSIVQKVRSMSSSARFAITTFRDYPERTGDPHDYPSRVDLDFSTDSTQIAQAIHKLNLGYGGDPPETALSGIMSGLNLKWRAGVHKVIITITDIQPHNPEPISGLTSAQIVKRAFEIDPAELYFIDLGDHNDQSYTSMANATGGKVFRTTVDSASNALLQSIRQTVNKPHAWINGPYITKLGKPLEMDGGGSYSKLGKIVKYEWDFDSDGRIDFTSTKPIITYTFNKELYGLMTLKVTDDHGLTSIANTHLIASQDGDDVPTAVDNCPLVDNPSQTDSDQDGIGDLCDETPGVKLPEQNRAYFECLIKQYFHPETQCKHLVKEDTDKSTKQDHTVAPPSISRSTPKPSTSSISQSATQSTPQVNDSTVQSRPQSMTAVPPVNSIRTETNQQFDRIAPKTADPKWILIALPIILASLFGGYLIIQKLRH